MSEAGQKGGGLSGNLLLLAALVVLVSFFALRRQEIDVSDLSGKLWATNNGYLIADIYNGGKKRVSLVKVRFTIRDRSEATVMERDFNLRLDPLSSGAPLAVSRFSVNCGCSVGSDQTIHWRILDAKRY